MIKLEIAAVHFDLDAKLKSYVNRKLGKLDRYVPKRAREPLEGRVVLTEEKGNAQNRFSCEVTLTLPHDVIVAKDSTINVYAAVDIAEAKLKAQLLKYKTKLTDHRPHQRLWRRLRQFRGSGPDNV